MLQKPEIKIEGNQLIVDFSELTNKNADYWEALYVYEIYRYLPYLIKGANYGQVECSVLKQMVEEFNALNCYLDDEELNIEIIYKGTYYYLPYKGQTLISTLLKGGQLTFTQSP